MKEKRVIGLLSALCCMLVIALTACGSSPGATTDATTAAPSDKQSLRYPVVGDIATFDPALAQDLDSHFPIRAVFTGLVALDTDLTIKPQLATSWQQSADGLTWTFKLKPNLTFSDGTPLTSQDVVWSINRALLPATKSSVSYYLSLIKDYKRIISGQVPTLIGTSLLAPDPQTVVIVLSQPAAYFLQTLSYATSYVVEKKLIDKYGAKFTDHLDEGGGAGPFKVASYSHTRGIELIPNDKYYGPKPKLQRLSVIFYNDLDGMYKAYQANQLDFTPVPAANIEAERHSPGFRETPILTMRYIIMNYLAKPFDSIKIRQAFALALNKDLIVQSALKNTFIPSNHIVPSDMPGYNPDLTGPDGVKTTQGDASKAKTLLEQGLREAGYASVAALPPITLTFYPRNQGFKDAITAAVQMWKNILGINVNVNIVARARMLDLQNATKGSNGPLQMWQAGWNADYPDPQNWTSTFFSNGSDYNQFNYGQNQSAAASEQQQVQQQLAQADVSKDQAQRLKLYYDAEQKIVNDVGWLPLWQEKLQSLTRPNIQNLSINAAQQISPDEWSKIYVSQ
ncbi:MAG: peptide ABC transporter substrate-binding protein [Chloroflexi bacterium]|nr:MAG: peptide ABC transporter substrate-binding protein [Chloroflexota bacterium]